MNLGWMRLYREGVWPMTCLFYGSSSRMIQLRMVFRAQLRWAVAYGTKTIAKRFGLRRHHVGGETAWVLGGATSTTCSNTIAVRRFAWHSRRTATPRRTCRRILNQLDIALLIFLVRKAMMPTTRFETKQVPRNIRALILRIRRKGSESRVKAKRSLSESAALLLLP